MNMQKILVVALATTMLVACQNDPYARGRSGGGITKSDAGTVLGGIGGAVIGSQFGKGSGQLVGVAAGTLLGAALGNSIGASLDRADMAYYNSASQTALETGQPGQALPWNNPESGNYGTVTPMNYYQTAGGQYCREYTQTINVGGRREEGYGRACRQSDGSWRIME